MTEEKKGFLNGIGANVLLLGLVSFLTDLSSEMIRPIIPLFLAGLGGGGLVVGLVAGIGDSVASLLKIFSGYWSDKLGKRKPFVFLGYGVSALSKSFFSFAGNWSQVLFLQAIERTGKGLRTAPRDAIISEYSGEKSIGKGFGIHRAMDSSGAVIGSLLALVLFWGMGFDFRTIFLIAGVTALFALLPLQFVEEKKSVKKEISLKIGLKRLSPQLRNVILITALFALGNFSYMFFILRAQELFGQKLGLVAPLSLYVLFNLVYALLSIPSGILSDKIGRKNTLICGYLLFSAVCTGFAFLNNFPSFIALFLLYGLVYALVDGNQRAFISELSLKDLKGTALGSFHTAIGLATLPASIIAGLLWQYISPQTAFLYGAIIAATASLLLFKKS